MHRQQSVVTGSVAVWTDSEGGGVVEMAIFALFCISQEAGAASQPAGRNKKNESRPAGDKDAQSTMTAIPGLRQRKKASRR